MEALIENTLLPHFGQFIRGRQLGMTLATSSQRRDLGTYISARPLSFSWHPQINVHSFLSIARHSRRRAFAVTRNVPKRRANETVRNWFNEVGRSWRCARDEQCELLKSDRTSERGRKKRRWRRRWKRQKSRRRGGKR